MKNQIIRTILAISLVCLNLITNNIITSALISVFLSIELIRLMYKKIIPLGFIAVLPLIFLSDFNLMSLFLLCLWNIVPLFMNKIPNKHTSPFLVNMTDLTLSTLLFLILSSALLMAIFIEPFTSFITNMGTILLLTYGFYVKPQITITVGLIVLLIFGATFLPILLVFATFCTLLYSQILINYIKRKYFIKNTIFWETIAPLTITKTLGAVFKLISLLGLGIKSLF